MDQLDANQLMRQSEQETGFSDWGETDFIEPFQVLIESLNSDACLSELGLHRTRLRISNLLRQRLRLQADRKTFPGIAAESIVQPIFMTGLPRAGTSFLNSLMSQDPANLSTLGWQMWCPSPPPNLSSIDHRAQINAATRLLDEQGFTGEEMRSKHEYGALKAEEDGHLCELQFLSNNFPAFWDVPGYASYLATHSYQPAHRMHHRSLQALQYGTTGRRWTLKSPEHVYNLKSLIEVYPDACFIIHHRDPSKVIASLFSLLAVHRALYSDKPLQANPDFVRGFVEQIAFSMERMIELRRDPALNSQFIDIQYLDLERDPHQTVARLYEGFGIPLSTTAVTAMQQWHKANRKGKHGSHVYRLGDYSLTQAEIHDRFSSYMHHFNIEREQGA